MPVDWNKQLSDTMRAIWKAEELAFQKFHCYIVITEEGAYTLSGEALPFMELVKTCSQLAQMKLEELIQCMDRFKKLPQNQREAYALACAKPIQDSLKELKQTGDWNALVELQTQVENLCAQLKQIPS